MFHRCGCTFGNVVNVKLELFRPEDFLFPPFPSVKTRQQESAHKANKILNEMLGPSVYGSSAGAFAWQLDEFPIATHQAFLIGIEEIKKKECGHKVYRVSQVSPYIMCHDCKKELKPKNGWEVVE